MSALTQVAKTRAPASVVLIRLLVGTVFFVEGVQKFLYPAALGAGRFAKIGLPWPDVLGPFVGGVETVGGALVLLGLLTRPAAVLLVVDISVAIVTTKIPILLGHSFGGLTLASLPRYGFLSLMHEARTDFSMWLGGLYLILVGAGRWSVDAWLAGRAGASAKHSGNS
ncbi:MAG TPA: DoxX family protein [Verrucomicrobiae bacterium]|nr:DoxX family protein [Verrucomicrobiae bacterium]